MRQGWKKVGRFGGDGGAAIAIVEAWEVSTIIK